MEEEEEKKQRRKRGRRGRTGRKKKKEKPNTLTKGLIGVLCGRRRGREEEEGLEEIDTDGERLREIVKRALVKFQVNDYRKFVERRVELRCTEMKNTSDS